MKATGIGENARLLAWLRETNTIWTASSVSFEAYDLEIQPADLDGDGSEEYVIDVTRECTEAVTCWGDRLYHAILG